MQPPQYPQLLRALAMQRLGAGDTKGGTAADWRMLSHAMVPGRPPMPPGGMAEILRQKIAQRRAMTSRPQMAQGQLGTQFAPTAQPGPGMGA